MKILFLQNVISPHILPLAETLASIMGANQFRYCSMGHITAQRRRLGWTEDIKAQWMAECNGDSAREQNEFYASTGVYDAEFLLCGIRSWSVLKKRDDKGLQSAYVSERWFKPSIGMFRLFSPRFLLMAIEFVALLSRSRQILYFPIGIHAALDMARLCGLLHGDLRCLFHAPKIEFEHKPGGRVWLKNGGDGKKYCLDKMRMWGYFVEPSKNVALPVQEARKTKPQEVKVLWVGRFLNLKRVDTIVRAVSEHANLKRVDTSLPKVTLDVYGAGPAEKRLKKKAEKYADVIKFHAPVPIAEVRRLMRGHDVYVLASNAYEGWGAVVSEALSEGMKVIGTYEAGSSATILPKSNLFHCGDWRTLQNLMSENLASAGIGEWNPRGAAKALIDIANGNKSSHEYQ